KRRNDPCPLHMEIALGRVFIDGSQRARRGGTHAGPQAGRAQEILPSVSASSPGTQLAVHRRTGPYASYWSFEFVPCLYHLCIILSPRPSSLRKGRGRLPKKHFLRGTWAAFHGLRACSCA